MWNRLRNVGHDLLVTAAMLALIGVAWFLLGATASADTPARCDAATDIATVYGASGTAATIVGLDKAASYTMVDALARELDPDLVEATTVYAVLEPATATASLFLYGPDGCFVAYIRDFGTGELTAAQLLGLFDFLGITHPWEVPPGVTPPIPTPPQGTIGA